MQSDQPNTIDFVSSLTKSDKRALDPIVLGLKIVIGMLVAYCGWAIGAATGLW